MRFLFAKHPSIAKRWAAHTPNIKALPETAPKTEEKTADLLPGVTLQPHQQRVRDAIGTGKTDRLLLYQTVGSGKSLAALSAADAAGDPYTAVVPASLRPNLKKEQAKFLDPATSPPGAVMSYSELAKRPPPHPATLLFDEAHSALSNPDSARGRAAVDAATKARRAVFMTGNPVVNHPSDFAALYSVLTGDPLTPEQFAAKYVREQPVRPHLLARLFGARTKQPGVLNEPEFAARLKGKVDYFEPDRPAVQTTQETVPVSMSKEQAGLYKGMYGRIPLLLRQKLKKDYPLTGPELTRLTAFLTGPRQVGLSTLPFMGKPDPQQAFDRSPKLQKALERLTARLSADPSAKALVFSNFIDAGLAPYHAALSRAGVPASVFHGGLTDAARKQLVDDYNADKLRVALLGPSGTEGLSFKGTRLVQRLDPHWHLSRGRQAAGRAVRFDSHTHLDPADRNVLVEDYRSRLPAGWFGKPQPGVDDWLADRAERRDALNRTFLDALKRVARGEKPLKS